MKEKTSNQHLKKVKKNNQKEKNTSNIVHKEKKRRIKGPRSPIHWYTATLVSRVALSAKQADLLHQKHTNVLDFSGSLLLYIKYSAAVSA